MMEKIKQDERIKHIVHKAGYSAYSTMATLGMGSLTIYLLFEPENKILLLAIIFVPLVSGAVVLNYRLKKDGYLDWYRDEVNRNTAIRKRIPWINAVNFIVAAAGWFVFAYYYSDGEPNLIISIVSAILFASLATYSTYKKMYRPLENQQAFDDATSE